VVDLYENPDSGPERARQRFDVAPFRSAHLELCRRELARREATVSGRLSVAAEPGE
jgi:hypothetical protein